MQLDFTDLIYQSDDEHHEFCEKAMLFTKTIIQLYKQLDELRERKNFILSIQDDLIDNFEEVQNHFLSLNKTIN